MPGALQEPLLAAANRLVALIPKPATPPPKAPDEEPGHEGKHEGKHKGKEKHGEDD